MQTPANPTTPARRPRGRPRDWDDKTAQNTIKSLDRAMEVFEHLSLGPGKALTTLSEELQEAPATIYRVLTTLQARDLVEFDAEAQLWHIGAKAFVIGARYLRRTSLVERARPILRQLMEDTGETANLGIMRGEAVLFVAQVETHASIRAFFPPGTLSPLHASGIGKVLMAEMDPARVARIVASVGLEPFTPRTISRLPDLVADLGCIRTRGYSVDDEERNIGMRCIAAPVFDAFDEPIAGLSVSGPTSRIGSADVERLAGHVIRAARQLSQAMGQVAPAIETQAGNQ